MTMTRVRWYVCAMIKPIGVSYEENTEIKVNTESPKNGSCVKCIREKRGSRRRTQKQRVCQRCTDKDGKCCLHSACSRCPLQERINILWPWQWNTPEHPVLARATNAEAKKNSYRVENFSKPIFIAKVKCRTWQLALLEHVFRLKVRGDRRRYFGHDSWGWPKNFVYCIGQPKAKLR